MSSRSVSDIQTRAEGESLYIRYRSDANHIKAGSYKQPLIQQIVHAAFDPLGGGGAAFSLR
jgi:hypothetical protein